MSNAKRIEQIGSLPPRQSYLGKVVSDGTHTGIVDAEFVDLEAATACGVIPQGWFEGLQKLCLSQKDDLWLSVILERGCVLIGERDLVKS